MSTKQLTPLSRLTAGLLALPLLLIACSQNSPLAPSEAHGPTLQPAATGAIIIRPGDIIQKLVDARPAGTAFLIKTGVHRRQSVKPKNGMTFVGEPGAVLDGENATTYAFWGDADNVTIRNLEIRNYKPADRMGAVRGATPQDLTSGWVIEDCEIHHNLTGGIKTGHRMVIRGNYIHHNGQTGMTGSGDEVLVEDNEVAFNGSSQYGTSTTGGAKFVKTRNLAVRNNDFHDNTENGIWMDIDCMDSLIEDNRVVDNAGQGIMFEISYRVVIRRNHVEGNGFGRPRWLYGAGIMISSSPDAEVYGNTVKNNAQGITAVMQDRGSGAAGLHETRNLYVHDNVITMDEGLTGLGQDIGNQSYYTSKNNRFRRNTYYLGPDEKYFNWMNGKRTENEWKSYGQDVDGVFHY